MKLDGEITVPARRTAVFEKLKDPRVFAACVEGVRDLTEIDPTHYTAVLETKVAYLRFKFSVAVDVLRLDIDGIEAKIEGTPIGIVGRLTATSTTSLEDVGDETRIRYTVDVALTGKLGSLGQPVLRSKAKEMEKLFAINLRRAIEGQSPPSQSPEPTSAAAVPTETIS